MSDGTVYVTGVKQLDRRLAGLSAKLQKKYGRQALRNAAKIVKEDYQKRVPVDTGAMRDAIVVRAAGKTVDRKTGKLRSRRGQIGISLQITRDSLARSQKRVEQKVTREGHKASLKASLAAIDAGSEDRKTKTRLKKAARQANAASKKSALAGINIEFRGFYPAFVELGNKNGNGKRPLTKALYESEAAIKREFVRQLEMLIISGGK